MYTCNQHIYVQLSLIYQPIQAEEDSGNSSQRCEHWHEQAVGIWVATTTWIAANHKHLL
jgi:hypothetical protein